MKQASLSDLLLRSPGFPKKAFGWALFFLGGLAFAVYLVALLDPVGIKMADDGDPFGDPGPWSDAVIGMAVSAAITGLGAWCIRSAPKLSFDIEPAPGWRLSRDEDGVRLLNPLKDASLLLARVDPKSIEGGVDRWAAICEMLDQKKNRYEAAVILPSGLHGHRSSFSTADEWLRSWTLVRNDLGIDVTYRCPLAAAGRDDQALDAMTKSLRVH